MKNLRQYIGLIWVGSILVLGCAKQGYPDGGPKDVTPPKAVSMTPENECCHFNNPSFKIAFDEYVTLRDAENNILVSPPMIKKPEYVIKGRSLVVNLKDSLRPNTTYLFQFNGAIVDFTEGNPLPYFEYAFTTGETIDSASIRGKVTDAKTNKPYEKQLAVLAYERNSLAEGADSGVVNSEPSYITKSQNDGSFIFSHIKEGNYLVVALEDGNRNLKLDPEEAVAFDRKLHVTNDTTPFNLYLSQPKSLKQRITKVEFLRKGRVEICTAAPMVEPLLEPKENLIWNLNATQDTLAIWTIEGSTDSISLIVKDPSGIDDTLNLRYREKRKGKKMISKERTKNNSNHLEIKPPTASKMAAFDTMWLKFENPVATIADSGVMVMDKTDSLWSPANVVLQAKGTKGYIDIKWHAGETYSVKILNGTITDIYNNPNDSVTFTTEIYPNNIFGKITVHLVLDSNLTDPTKSAFFVAQLTDASGKIIASTQVKNNTFAFPNLKPDKYKIQILIDEDGDNAWTTGDYWLQQLPEQILFLEKTLELRENWDIEETWHL